MQIVEQLKDISKKYFNWQTTHFSRWWEYEWIVRHISLKDGMRMLDAGTGKSPIPLYFAERGALVITVDNGKPDEGDEWGYIDYQKFHPNVQSFNSDFSQLPQIAKGELDIITCISVLEHLPAKDRQRAWKEFARMLQLGGNLVLTLDLQLDGFHLWNHSRGQEVEPVTIHGNMGTLLDEAYHHGFVLQEYELYPIQSDRVKVAGLVFRKVENKNQVKKSSSTVKAAKTKSHETNRANIVYGCVVESREKYLSQALRLVQSLRWFGGSQANADFIVAVVGEMDTEYRNKFEKYGVKIRKVGPFVENHPYSNKLSFFNLAELKNYETIVLLDCDTLIVRDPSPYFSKNKFQAKIADLPTVPLNIFEKIFETFELKFPEVEFKTTFTNTPTIFYCNSGVLIVPVQHLDSLIRSWQKYDRLLAERIHLLGDYQVHCDQASLTLAYTVTPVPFEELPVEMNFPLHLTDYEQPPEMLKADPVILHYHHLFDEDGYLKESPYPNANKYIQMFNQKLQQNRDEHQVIQDVFISSAKSEDNNLSNNFNKRVVCIAGMHRSGTSMVTRMLNKLGFYLGDTSELMEAAADNPEGFWENWNFVQINDHILEVFGGSWDCVPLFPQNWWQLKQLDEIKEKAQNLISRFSDKTFWAWKDPRNSLTFPFWYELIPDMKVLVCLRNPLEVAHSLNKRNGFSIEKGIELWFDYNLSLFLSTAPSSRLVTHYDAFFNDPYLELKRIVEWLDLKISNDEIKKAAFVLKSNLRHHHETKLTEEFAEKYPEIVDLYETMMMESGITVENYQRNSLIQNFSSDKESQERNQIDSNSRALYENAQETIAQGDYEIAKKLLHQLVDLEPVHSDALNDLGVLYFQEGKKFQSIYFFRRAIESNPDHLNARKNLADVYLNLGLFDFAIQIYKDILQEHPEDVEVLITLGKLYFEITDFETARQFFEKAYQKDSGNQEIKEYLKLISDISETTESREGQPDFNEKPVGSPLVSIIIPIYNQLNYTQKCLESIYANTNQEIPFEIIVVDDGSTDGSDVFLKKVQLKYKNLKYVRNTINSGFAKSCNKGVTVARGKYIVFLNNDTEPQPDWLNALINCYQTQDDVGIVGAKLLYPDRTVQHAGIEFYYRVFGDTKIPWPMHVFRGVDENFSEVCKTKEVTAVTGACLLIEKALFQELGGFDESYPMYFEDIDLNMKVRNAGKKIIYCSDSVVIHHEGKSGGNQKNIDLQNLKSGKIFLQKWKKELGEMLNRRHKVKHHVVWSAPFFNPSGYASEAIAFALGLNNYLDLQIYNDDPTRSENFIKNMPGHWREILFHLHSDDPYAETIRIPGDLIFISHQPAYCFKKLDFAKYNIGRTMFETDRIPDFWVPYCNQMDEIWVPSEFNVETFSKSGVDEKKIKVIPEAIDTSVFDPNLVEPMELPQKAGFNFLSIFEWTERKGWDVLLRAYFEAFDKNDDVCLYLRTFSLNHYDDDTEAYIQQKINHLIKRYGYNSRRLPRYVILPKQLPFKEMLRLYKSVDAFVLPSRGEGWGRPYMEAMCMGLPVIGTNWSGNTAFMTESNSYLIRVEDLVKIKHMEIPFYIGHRWAQPSKNHLKNIMREVVQNPGAARKKGEQARKDIIEKFSLDAVAKVVVQRLQEIEESILDEKGEKTSISLPSHEAQTSHLEVKKSDVPNVVWEGSQFVHHSLALVNRELVLGLIEAGVNVSVIPYEQDQFKPGKNSPYRKILEAQNKKFDDVDVYVRHHWPPNLTPPLQGHWVIIQPWEFGSLPKKWVEVFSEQVDELWVPSQYVREIYIQSGVPAERVFVIPNGVNPNNFHPDVTPFRLKTKKKFKFLFVGGTIYRKGIDILLEAYLKAFSSKDDVCLVIKDIGSNSFYKGQTIGSYIKTIRQNPDAPEIEYIERILPTHQLAGLYKACDVLVHPYRGEGFGLPVLEAMACGTPVIVTDGGATSDFCNEKNSLKIKSKKVVFSEKKVGNKETVDYPWLLEVDIKDLIEKLRFAYENPDYMVKLGEKASESVLSHWTWEKSIQKILHRLDALQKIPIRRFIKDKIGHQPENQHRPEIFYAKAIKSFEEGKLEEAANHLKVVTELDPNYAEAYNLLGRIYFEARDYQGAKTFFSLAIQKKPDFIEAQRNFGEVLLALEEYDSAIQTFITILKNHPDDVPTLIKLADLYFECANPHQAREIICKALMVEPKNPELWKKYSISHKLCGEKKEYLVTLKKYLEMNPEDATAYNELGVLYWENGEIDEAIKCFEKSITLNGCDPNHLKNLARAYIEVARFEEAIKILILLMQAFPRDLEAYETMAALYAENGDYKSAQEIIKKYLSKFPGDRKAETLLELLQTPEVYVAYQLINAGEFENAKKILTEYLKKEQNSINAKLGLGSILFNEKKYEEAKHIYSEILKIDSSNEEAIFYLGKIYLLLNQKEKFKKLYQNSCEIFDSVVLLQKLYIEYLLTENKLENAEKKLQEFIQKVPDDVDAYIMFGKIYYEKGQKDLAEKYYRKALKLDPDNQIIQENLRVLAQAV